MSGRAHVILSDGRQVRGFRKTLKRRAPSALLPDWTLTMRLPQDMRFMGVDPIITGKRKSWVISQGCARIRQMVPDFDGVVHAVLSADPTAFLSPQPCQLRFDGPEVIASWARHCQVISNASAGRRH